MRRADFVSATTLSATTSGLARANEMPTTVDLERRLALNPHPSRSELELERVGVHGFEEAAAERSVHRVEAADDGVGEIGVKQMLVGTAIVLIHALKIVV